MDTFSYTLEHKAPSSMSMRPVGMPKECPASHMLSTVHKDLRMWPKPHSAQYTAHGLCPHSSTVQGGSLIVAGGICQSLSLQEPHVPKALLLSQRLNLGVWRVAAGGLQSTCLLRVLA